MLKITPLNLHKSNTEIFYDTLYLRHNKYLEDYSYILDSIILKVKNNYKPIITKNYTNLYKLEPIT